MTPSENPPHDFGLASEQGEGEALVSCRLDRSADFCYRLFRDVEAVPRWLMVVERAKVHTRDDEGRPARVEFVGCLEGDSVSYTLDYSYDDARRTVRWRHVDGELAALTGSASFEPTDDGGCLLQYRLRSELLASSPRWNDALYASRPAESVVVEFCEWVCSRGSDR